MTKKEAMKKVFEVRPDLTEKDLLHLTDVEIVKIYLNGKWEE